MVLVKVEGLAGFYHRHPGVAGEDVFGGNTVDDLKVGADVIGG